MPSYSSGVHMPRNPSRPISAIAARGNSHVRSHSAAKGSIFSFANSRASSTTCSRMSVAVDIKPHARFSAEPSRRDHFLEQSRRPVFQVAEAVLQYLHDREADVEPNQVRERERPQRMLHAQRHHLIHRLGRRDAFLHTEDRFIDHRHQDAVGHEPRGVLHDDRRLPELLCKRYGPLDGVVRRLLSTYHFNERHYRHRIHEVHADHAGRVVGVLGQLRDGNGRGVAGKNRVGRRKAAKGGKDLELHLRVLGHRFHHDFGVLRRVQGHAGRNPCQDSRPLRVAHRALLDLALQILLDRLESAAERILGDVDQHRIPSVLREHVRDAVAHRTGAHHGDFAHAARAWVSGVWCLVNTFLLVNRNSVPATSAIVATTPPSGPNAPPSTQACDPGAYSTTGVRNRKPLTGASKRIASPAFQPKCAPQASAMPPAEKNASDSQTAASATLTVLKTVAFGFQACPTPNRIASRSVAGITPNASDSRRSGKPRNASSSPSAAQMRPRMSGSAMRGQMFQSPVKCTRAPSSTTASPIATLAMTAPSARPRSQGASAGRRQPRSDQLYFSSRRPTIQVARPNAITSSPPERTTAQSGPPQPGTTDARPSAMPMPITKNRTAQPSAIAPRFTSSPPDPRKRNARHQRRARIVGVSVSRTGTAITSFRKSPSRNGQVPSCAAARRSPVRIASCASPPRWMSTRPATTATVTRRHVAKSANLPTAYAANGYASKYPPVGPTSRAMPGRGTVGVNTGNPAAPIAR